jgi:guanylate kinase
MLLIRLSGHSGAGKSRLLAALPKFGMRFKKTVLYTSRPPRLGEIDGEDYHFLSSHKIKELPRDRYFVGKVREMWQAVDLVGLNKDLQSNDTVIIEIFHQLWLNLTHIITKNPKPDLRIASVFMTAVDPEVLKNMPDEKVSKIIRENVRKILEWRNKDDQESILRRADSAVEEILTALKNPDTYSALIHSAPEGPDGKDEWTRNEHPTGLAKEALNKFLHLIRQGNQTV